MSYLDIMPADILTIINKLVLRNILDEMIEVKDSIDTCIVKGVCVAVYDEEMIHKAHQHVHHGSGETWTEIRNDIMDIVREYVLNDHTFHEYKHIYPNATGRIDELIIGAYRRYCYDEKIHNHFDEDCDKYGDEYGSNVDDEDNTHNHGFERLMDFQETLEDHA